MNVKSFRRLAFACFTIVLNTCNLCQLKFVNNEDLPNTGNLDFTLRQGGRGRGGMVSPRKSVVQSACQYDVTTRVSDFQNGQQSVHRRDG